MKRKEKIFKPYGLRARFAISLGISAVVCGLLFFGLYNAVVFSLKNYFEKSDFMESHVHKQEASLQEFISRKNISSKNLKELKTWEYKQPLVLLELYSNGKCIYSSVYDDAQSIYQYAIDFLNEERAITIQLADEKVFAILYSDFTYKYYVIGTTISALIAFALFILLFLRSNRKLIHYICRLNEEIHILEGGNLEYPVSIEGNDELTDLATSMNRMRESFQQQLETEQSLHQANIRLVTEMSHDLRTPLTSIMLYLEIIRSHRYKTNEELEKFLEKIDIKTRHMKQISDHLFEHSLAEMPQRNKQTQVMFDAFNMAVMGLEDDLVAHGFSVVTDITWDPCYVDVYEEYIRRIFDNIASNIIKYAEPSADVMINSINEKSYCGFSVINSCSARDLQEKGSGIGIESIASMMRQMNGSSMVEQTETVFEITILFPKQ